MLDLQRQHRKYFVTDESSDAAIAMAFAWPMHYQARHRASSNSLHLLCHAFNIIAQFMSPSALLTAAKHDSDSN